MTSPPLPVPAQTAPYDGAHGAGCALVSALLGLTQSLTVFGINNNLPALQGALGATAVEVSWLSTAYFATALSAVVLMTKLRLQVGIERFATWSIAVFAAVSLWPFVAPSLVTAVAARAVLGLAAGPTRRAVEQAQAIAVNAREQTVALHEETASVFP